MVRRATLTTVPSSITIPEPSVVASTSPRPAAEEYATVPEPMSGDATPAPGTLRGGERRLALPDCDRVRNGAERPPRPMAPPSAPPRCPGGRDSAGCRAAGARGE